MSTQIRGSQIKQTTVTADRLVLTDITELSNLASVGTISTGVWQGTQLGASYVPKLNSITAPDGSVSLNDNKITNLATPTSDGDAATKQYVDTLSAGLRSFKEPARVASSGDVSISTPGATISGITMASGDRVLLHKQTDKTQNGIYVWTAADAPLTRAADANTSEELQPNHYLWVSEGANADQAFVMTANAPIVLGTTELTYVVFSGIASFNAGNGLVKNGNTIDVVSANSAIVANADNIALTLDGGTLAITGAGLKIANSGVGTGQISDNAVVAAKIDSSVAGDGLSGGGGFAFKVNTSGAVGIDSDNVVLKQGANVISALSVSHFSVDAGTFGIKSGGVGTGQIADNAVNGAKLDASVAGDGLQGGGGFALKVASANGGIVVNADNIALTLDGSTLAVGASGVKVASNGITATEIASNAVTTGKLIDNAVTAAKLDSSVLASGGGLTGAAGFGISVQNSFETPFGTVDGSNTSFALNHAPKSGTLLLFRNGLLQDSSDYSISSNNITFTSAPSSGDSVRAFYLY